MMTTAAVAGPSDCLGSGYRIEKSTVIENRPVF
jgi:hypothetical protein